MSAPYQPEVLAKRVSQLYWLGYILAAIATLVGAAYGFLLGDAIVRRAAWKFLLGGAGVGCFAGLLIALGLRVVADLISCQMRIEENTAAIRELLRK